MNKLITIIYIAFLIIGTNGLSAQTSSNQDATAGSKIEIKRIDSLNSEAEKSIQDRSYSLAQNLSYEAIDLSGKIGYSKGQGESYINLGNLSYNRRNFIASESYGKKAIDIFQNSSSTLLAKAETTWANAVWAQSRFDEAIISFQKALELFLGNRDSVNVGRIYSLLALAEEERGNYSKSFQYAIQAMNFKNQGGFIAIGQLYADVGDYDASLEFYNKVTDKDLPLLNDVKIGETYFFQKKYDSALYFYKKYVRILGAIDTSNLSKPYSLMGELYLTLGKYDTALKYLLAALDGFEKVNDRNWIMRTQQLLGKAYQETGNTEKGIFYARELLRNSENAGAKQFARDAHYLLYQLFGTLHKTDSAYAHLVKYTALNNALGIDLSARNLAFFKSSAQLDQAELRIKMLNSEKQLQIEELRRSSQQKIFLMIGVVVLIILFSILARNILLKNRNESNLRRLAENDLEIGRLEHAKEVSKLEMQVLRVQMNPHFIFNSINSINRFILRDDRPDASDYLTKFSRLIRMILQNSQNPLISLEDELASLRLYLELEQLRFDNRFTYHIDVEDAVDLSMTMVPPIVLQPFVENAIWHGLMPKTGEGQINIHISTDQSILIIKIADDGIGRAASALQNDQAATHRSLGLEITSQRIKMMFPGDAESDPVYIGDLVDAAGKPAGTEVTLKIPIHYAKGNYY
jgi:tetratricopeptide (TPR) repeat protein